MVKTKNSTKVLAILVALILILTALIFIIPHKQTQTVEAAELTPEQHAERRATPGLYKTGTTTLITSWEDLVNSGVITVSSNSFQVDENIAKGDLVCKSIDGLTSLEEAFANCSNLTNIDCYNLDTSEVTSMNMMFFSCTSIKKLDLSNFVTKKVTDISSMFMMCDLDELNITSFVISSSCDASAMLGVNYYTANDLLGDEEAVNQIYYGKTEVDQSKDKMLDESTILSNAKNYFISVGLTEDEATGNSRLFGTFIRKLIAPTTKIPDSVSIALPGTGYKVSGSKATEPVYYLNGMENKTLVPYVASQDVPSTGVVSNMLSVVICLACLSALVITLTNKKRKIAK